MAKGKSPVIEEFARKVRLRRYRLGLTQEQLAERANFHVNYIGGIERVSANPLLKAFILARALEISPKDLMLIKKSCHVISRPWVNEYDSLVIKS